MSEIKWGLISKRDGEAIELILLHVLFYFAEETNNIYTTEVGIFNGDSSRMIHKFITDRGKNCFHTAIDNNHDFEVKKPFPECHLIVGNSNEVYNQLLDESQHFIFIDSLHTFPAVVSDFFCYSKKVKKGGYICFHDSGSHIKDFHDYQRVGDKGDKDMYIRVRPALQAMWLLDDKFPGWQKVCDVADWNDAAGGVAIFKKLY